MAPKKQGKGRKAVALAKATRKFSVRSERKAPRGGQGGKKGGTDNSDVILQP